MGRVGSAMPLSTPRPQPCVILLFGGALQSGLPAIPRERCPLGLCGWGGRGTLCRSARGGGQGWKLGPGGHLPSL